ncbi:MAG: sulfite exporter TauE/SafE family protein [Hyphomicrobiaceae bacterium]|nr:sulfite exporter TauE/SafE family protein [Hyphomicrobiaceae bacterium]MCC0025304.1 sulfite exporter TauE/SafE family protein [Hyphomicrobiaceae bacterium]
MPIQDLIVIFAALFVGGAMKSATGLGLPIIGIPVLTAYSNLHFAIAVILIPSVLSNAWQVWKFRKEHTPRYIAIAIFIGACAGIILGVTLLAYLPERWLNLGVALVVTVFLVSRVLRPDWRLSDRMARLLAFPASISAGILQGATGISAPAVLMYLSSVGLDRGSFIFSVSLLFLVSGAAQVPAMMVAGLLGPHQIFGSALALIPVVAGMWLGEHLGKYISVKLFNQLIMGFLVVLVIKLAWSVFT